MGPYILRHICIHSNHGHQYKHTLWTCRKHMHADSLDGYLTHKQENIHTYIHTYIQAYIQTNIHTCIHRQGYIHTQSRMHTGRPAYIHAHMSKHRKRGTHEYTPWETNIHTHAQKQTARQSHRQANTHTYTQGKWHFKRCNTISHKDNIKRHPHSERDIHNSNTIILTVRHTYTQSGMYTENDTETNNKYRHAYIHT